MSKRVCSAAEQSRLGAPWSFGFGKALVHAGSRRPVGSPGSVGVVPDAAPPLPMEVLVRRGELPRKPAPVTLVGKDVKLVPLELVRDTEPLHAVSDGRPVRWDDRSFGSYDPDAVIWRFMPAGPFGNSGELVGYLGQLLAAPDGLCLCVMDAPIRASSLAWSTSRPMSPST